MVTALRLVNHSGSDVAVARRTSPIHERDKPVNRAMISP
jgi:hypothetical protein